MTSLIHQQADCRAAHVADILAEMLPRGEAPTLDALDLCPDEPLAVIEEPGGTRTTRNNNGAFWKKAYPLRAKYPGFQADHWVLEEMKYGNTPDAGAPSSEFVRARISHAKALWSRDISAGWTQFQFRDWLRLHIDGETWIPPLWPEGLGWSEALQVLRIAFGLPRFAPTETWELRPPPRRVSPRRPPR
jgi:hypothetical protein